MVDSVSILTAGGLGKEEFDTSLKIAKLEMKIKRQIEEISEKDKKVTNLEEENTLLRETLKVKDEVVVQLTNQVV